MNDATEQNLMSETGTDRTELKNTGYEIFIGILSVLSILNLVFLYAITDTALATVLWVMNGILSGIFLIDFTYRLFTAESKTHYFFRMFGWADLLASLPVQQVKILRLFRLVRVGRLLRAYGVRNVGRSLVQDRAGSALLTLLLMGILVLEFGSLQMLNLEQYAPGANITTASDALWYTIVTISTVGYGDRYPVTNDGTGRRLDHHRHRRRHLRYLHRLPRQPVPRTIEEEHPTGVGHEQRHCSRSRATPDPHGPTTNDDRRDQSSTDRPQLSDRANVEEAGEGKGQETELIDRPDEERSGLFVEGAMRRMHRHARAATRVQATRHPVVHGSTRPGPRTPARRRRRR